MPSNHIAYSHPMLAPDRGDGQHSVELLIAEIFQRHGLVAATDVEQVNPYAGAGPLGLSLDAEAIAELRAAPAWDDTPTPDKLVNLFLKMARRAKPDRPEPTVSRMVGIVPATNRAVIIAVYTFNPIRKDDIADLRKVGRWSLGVRDGRDNPVAFSGDIHDHEDMAGAFELIRSICEKWQKELGLEGPKMGRGPRILSPEEAGALGIGGFEGLDKPIDHSRLPGREEHPHNLFPALPDDTIGRIGTEIVETLERLLPGVTMKDRFAAVADLGKLVCDKPPESAG